MVYQKRVPALLCLFLASLGEVRSQSTPPNTELHACTESIWSADTNSFPSTELTYNLNGAKLFTYVNEARFSTGTYPSFINLLESFNPQLGQADNVGSAAISNFLNSLMATGPMQTALGCLQQWGYVSNEADLRAMVEQFWFLQFTRSGGPLDSSGFQHCFQGEIRETGNDVTGFHGWVNAYLAEKAGDFVYGTSNAYCGEDLPQVNNFYYLGALKPISSMWIGKSPELEMSLYTVCFFTRRNQNCNIEVANGYAVTIVNYDMTGVTPTTIGTCYPNC